MSEVIKKPEVIFTLAEQIKTQVLIKAEGGSAVFDVTIPLQTGQSLVHCFQGEGAKNAAELARRLAISEGIIVSDITNIGSNIYAFVE